MTKEEAIQYIDGLHVVPCEQLKEFCDERNEAIDMAIEALSLADAIPIVDLTDGKTKLKAEDWVYDDTPSAETHEIRTETHECVKETHDTDLISRADAIEAVCRTRCGDKAKGCPAHSCLVIEEFDALPSAETHEIRTETHGVCLISKDDAIEAVAQQWLFEASVGNPYVNDDDIGEYRKLAEELFEDVPSADAEQGVGRYENAMQKLREMPRYLNGIKEKQITKISADAVQGYTEWLEKIIVDNEGANEWLCEDTPDLEWCEMNCHYTSIQTECLRHLYEVSKGGDDE